MSFLNIVAQTVQRKNCATGDTAKECITNFPKVDAGEEQLRTGLNVLFAIIGAIAVVMIILAAITLANSEGNPEKISGAKRTIIFAAIGLVISLSAQALVFVLLGRL